MASATQGKPGGRGGFLILWVGAVLALVWGWVAVAPGVAAGASPARWRALLKSVGDDTTLDARLLRVIALVNLGEVEQGLREFDAMAQADFEPFAAAVIDRSLRTLQSAPEDLIALNSLAFAHHALAMAHDRQEEELREAIHWYRSILAVDPDNVWIRHYLALAHYDLGELDRAVAVLQDALARDSRNQYTHLLLGFAYSKQKAYARAALHLLQAPDALRTYRSLQDLGRN